MSATKWQTAIFLIGLPMPKKHESRKGHIYRGLGLHEEDPGAGGWTITHLNTGHAAYRLYGERADILPAATAIAEAVDWSFKGLGGWKADADFLAKLDKATEKHAKRLTRCASAKHNSAEVADEIAALRSA